MHHIRFAVLALAVSSMITPSDAQEFPAWRPSDICARDSADGHCRLYEAAARQQIAGTWTVLPEAWRVNCLTSFRPPLEPSWRILSDCIENEMGRATTNRSTVKEPAPRVRLAQATDEKRQATDAARREAEEAKQKAEAEARAKAAADAAAKQREMEARHRKALEEARLAVEAEEAKQKAEAEARAKAAAADAAAKQREMEARHRKALEEARLAVEAEEAKQKAEAEARAKAAADAAAKQREMEARHRKALEEARLAVEAEEAKRKAEAEACGARLANVAANGAITFAFAGARLDPKANATLDRVADAVKACSAFVITVEGHTDNVGPDEANMRLSQRRAEAVAAYLISKGVDRTRIKAVGYGKSRPIAKNETREGRARNRRIDFAVE